MSRRSPEREPKQENEPEIRPLRPSEMESLKGGAQPGPSDVNAGPVPPKSR